MEHSGQTLIRRAEESPVLPREDMLKHVPAFLAWLATEHSPHTVTDYRCKLSQFGRWLESSGLDFSRPSVALYLAHLQQQGKRPRTIRGALIALNCYCRYLRSEELEPPHLAHLRLPRLDAPQRVSPTCAQVQALFSGAARMPQHTPVARYRRALTQAILATLAYTGVRTAELLGLDVDDYSTDPGGQRVLRVRKGKGNQVRWVPVNAELAEHLEEWLTLRQTHLRERESAALWVNDKRGRLALRGLEAVWAGLLEHAGLTGSGIQRHSMRHWFGTGAAAAMDLKTASVLLGHGSIQTTALYLHSEPEKMRQATESLIGMLVRREVQQEQEARAVRPRWKRAMR